MDPKDFFFCKSCGQILGDDYHFCPHCGFKRRGRRQYPLYGATVLYTMAFLMAVAFILIGYQVFGTHEALAGVLYAIAAALGPVALIGIIYDQLLKGSLSDAALTAFSDLSQTVFRNSIDKLKDQRMALEDQTMRVFHIAEVGLIAAFPERFQAFPQISAAIRAEEEEIFIVGTSFLGLRRPGLPGEEELTRAITGRIKDDRCKVHFLLTHPAFAHLRQNLEVVQRRENFHIAQEILETVIVLKDLDVPCEDVRFIKGTPTVFGIMTSRLMLLNPYPYQRQAYTSVTFLLDSSHGEFDPMQGQNPVYRAYADDHFRAVWEGKNVDQLEGYDLMSIKKVFDESLVSMGLAKSDKHIDYGKFRAKFAT